MEEPDGGFTTELSPEVTTRAAVALVVPTITNATVGAIVRATHHDHHVILVTPAAPSLDRDLLDSLSVTCIEADVDAEPGAVVPEAVVRRARRAGFPGIAVQRSATATVDFAATADRLEGASDYVVEAVEQSSIGCRPAVLAAIPAYNEGAAIEAVVAEARAVADEVLVVDDGSTDETVARARAAGATVVQHDRNRGYGAALGTIFSEADRCGAETLVVLNGDGQHSPAEIPKLTAALADADADVAIGSRFVDGANGSVPRYRRFGLAVINTLTNFSLGENDGSGEI
jgi:hypothetical protein